MDRLRRVVASSAALIESIRLQLAHLDELHQQLDQLSQAETDLPASVQALDSLDRLAVECDVRRDIELACGEVARLAALARHEHAGSLRRYAHVRRQLIRRDLEDGRP